MKRGPLESTSLLRRASVHGHHLTIQKVPLHRVYGVYWAEKRHGQGGGSFLGDGENEFLANLDDLDVDIID